MNTCTKCRKTKPLEEFGKSKKNIRSHCNKCRTAYQKEYTLLNPQIDALWRIKNKEKISASRKLRYLSMMPEISILNGMKNRCLNKNSWNYKYYGNRGISICQRWLAGPAKLRRKNFIEDMGKRPSSKHSIDRINPDGNYEPSNCRWATQVEQCANRRSHGKR